MISSIPISEHTCASCGFTRDTSLFYRAKSASGYMVVCKECHKARVKERQAERYATDPSVRAKKITRVVARQAERYATVPAFRKAKVSNVTRRQAERYASEAHFRVSQCMSVSIRESIRLGKAGRSWELLVGYCLGELMSHLESYFEPGMTWENYGSWHIDHVIPQAAFSFCSPEDLSFGQCWALENLRPLWATDNIKKSDRLPDGTRARKFLSAGGGSKSPQSVARQPTIPEMLKQGE